MAIFTFGGKSVKKGEKYVAYQPPFRPLYGINTTSSRLPADGTGKPLSWTARRTLQLVNPTISSEVISVSIGFTARSCN